MRSLGRIVLISRDAALRSGLAARLGLTGLTLSTLDGADRHHAREHALVARILILDAEHGAPGLGLWLARLLEQGCAARVIVVGEDGDPGMPDGVFRVGRPQAVRAIADQLSRWRHEEAVTSR